ncbi:hypothetical protein [Peribacillus simplex]|uniref:hypothetical protein n=1 Tax=Peribacillus simplex TaxID=1478 RepID=UPI002853250B|nr:hypothetical protein [Peribacillus simplex]MDR4927932.1 hypothetical protein [Peribacillus simplex]
MYEKWLEIICYLIVQVSLVEAKEAIVDMAIGEELIINFDCTQATGASCVGLLPKVMKSRSLSKSMTLNGVKS